MALAIHTVGSTEGSNSASSLTLLSVTEKELKTSKQEFELKDVSTAKSGKKSQLMPTDGQQTKFNIQDYHNANDPMNGTSIYFMLTNFYVNNLMQTNQEQMSATASALNANQSALEIINQGFQNLSSIVSKPDTADKTSTQLFEGILCGIGAALVVGIAIGLLVASGGLAAPLSAAMIFGAVAGITAGVGMIATGAAVGATNESKPGTVSFLTDSENTGGQAVINQTKAQTLSGISTSENNETNRNMQGLQSVNSLQQQYANMFAQMISYFSKSMGS